MLKKILLGALIAISTFGVFSTSEAANDNTDKADYCCSNYYCDDNDNNYCGRGYCGGRNGCY